MLGRTHPWATHPCKNFTDFWPENMFDTIGIKNSWGRFEKDESVFFLKLEPLCDTGLKNKQQEPTELRA